MVYPVFFKAGASSYPLLSFSSWPRTVEYDGVGVTWDNTKYPKVWGPSIDTLTIAKSLKKILPKSMRIQTAIEIGCGSGFLSKFVLNRFLEMESMIINDINPMAILCARDNIQDPRAIFKSGNGHDVLLDNKFDLIVCNPPYIPRPNSIEKNPYEGVGLLSHLIHEAGRYLNDGGHIIIGLSNLADNLVFTSKPEIEFKTIEEREVPLKVNNVLNNREWIEYLQDRNLVKSNHNGYEFWHRIKTICAKKI